MAEPRFDHRVSENRIEYEYEYEYRDAEYEYEPTAGGGKWGGKWGHPASQIVRPPKSGPSRT